jgi:transcriptional regulator with XRE-family HTH domain
MINEKQIPKRIRQMRLERNMTQKELADAVGVTKGYISRIENGETAPPVGTLIALAQGLSVEFNAFFDVEDPEVYVTVTRKNERPSVARDRMISADYEHLALNFPNRAFESYIIKTADTGKRSQVNQHKGQELLYVLKGKVEFNVNGQSHILEEGDAIHFNSSYPHYGSCLSEGGAELIGVVYKGSDTENKE